MKIKKTYLFILAFLCLLLLQNAFSQQKPSESIHPYYVNYWISGSITAVSAIGNYLAIPMSSNKPKITQIEINALNRDVISVFDHWALNQDPSKRSYYSNMSDNLLAAITVLPSVLLFDKNIRQDWLDILIMYLETMSITNNIYEYSFLGPAFQARFRPAVYYDALPMDQRIIGFNRSSFYSGHTASATAATFFMAKVISDYHPEMGGYKYLMYGAAVIPPLILGYVRVKSLNHFPSDIMVGFGVGALCGIIIPEIHKIHDKNISLSLFTTPESAGLAINWQPDFLK